jgi:hypothetical protein
MPSIKLSATNTNLSHKFHFFARKQPLFLAPGQTATVEEGVTPFPTNRRRMVPVVHPSVPLSGMIIGVSIVGLSKNPWFISWEIP